MYIEKNKNKPLHINLYGKFKNKTTDLILYIYYIIL